ANATGLAQTGSGQLADADVLEVDRRALGLQAQVAGPRLDAVAPGHLLAVDPQAQLPVHRPHVVVVALPGALALALTRGDAAAVRRGRGERLELRPLLAGREHVAVRGEPGCLLLRPLLVLLGVAVVEDLHLDAGGQLARLEPLERLLRRPDEDAGVA